MSYGLQVFNAGGGLVFDSNVAVGGVSLGFYTIPTGGASYLFSDFETEAGAVLWTLAGDVTEFFTTDHALGYLRFVFDPITAGATVALFAV